uniref:Uncharacterized protein n=1 Tax=Anopheles quadriannulatus TaxID=34691 RepID=A0A182XS79_ANOQN
MFKKDSERRSAQQKVENAPRNGRNCCGGMEGTEGIVSQSAS